MSNLLSAASLLLAVVGILYGLWYGEITDALKEKVALHAKDNKKALSHVSSVLSKRAIPLAIAAFLVSIIFLPDVIKLFIISFNNYRTKGFTALKDYGAVETAFCFVIIFAIFIYINVMKLISDLYCLRKKISGKDK